MVEEEIDKYLDSFDDLDEDGEIGIVVPVCVHISDMLEYLYPEDKVDIVSEKGIMLFKNAVVKDLFKEGSN
nr:MAG TPA: hypothetical protein [Caudoviricetes sp.]